MTRKYLAGLTALAAVAFVTVVSGTGCATTGIGDPCIPEAEYAPDFLGFDQKEVNVESKSFQCLTRLCLVNHFQGRVSCPYGQNASASNSYANPAASNPPTFACDGEHGAPNSPNDPCCLPGVHQPVLNDPDAKGTPGSSSVTPVQRAPQLCGPHRRQGGVLLVPLRERQRQDRRRRSVLPVPRRLPVHPARHAHRRGQRRPDRRVLHQEEHRLQRRERLVLEPVQLAAEELRSGQQRAALTPRQRARSGQQAELAVTDYLVASGYRVLARNLRLGALELDVVAQKGDVVAVVEVRTRGPGSLAGPFESVTGPKRARLRRAVQRLWRERLSAMGDVKRVRIDVAAVTFDGGRTRVEYVEGALE